MLAMLATGCAQQAVITTWKPAQIEVAGMQRLAVLGFSGEESQAVKAALSSRLSRNEFYTLADLGDSHPIRPASATAGDFNLLSLDDLGAAREAGIDGLLVGDIIEYRSEVQPVADPPTPWRWISPAQPQVETDDPQEGSASQGSGEMKREATVSIAFRLIEVDTGKIRATRQTSHSTSEAVSARSQGTPPRSDMFNDLTCQCVDEFLSTLAPHQVTERIPLAPPVLFRKGATLVHNGNEFASRGRWGEAIVAWEQALAANPNNDAALFNLSIAHANRQEFDRAESFAIRAMNVRQHESYRAGLERIRAQRTAYDQTLQQRRDLSMTSCAGNDAGRSEEIGRRR